MVRLISVVMQIVDPIIRLTNHGALLSVAEDLRQKQQEIRKKRLEDLKNKDGERQRAAEERRKRREQEEEVRCLLAHSVDIDPENLVTCKLFIVCAGKDVVTHIWSLCWCTGNQP